MQYYQQAIDADAQNPFPQALFNLGNTLYVQRKFDAAADEYNQFLQMDISPALKEKAYFNIGNCSLAQGKWEESIAAFKSALSLNSLDVDARYNLAYAMAMLNNQKQQQQKQKKPSLSKIDKQKKQPPKKEDTMPPDEINRLLNSLSKSEQETQEKIQKENALTHVKTLDKDW
jgi:tetratricopeptide (TPR) repeat protein